MPDAPLPAPFEAYVGDEPYLFASYAHLDGAVVFPELIYLRDQGYRVWYDEGIDPGNEWPEEVAKALAGSAFFVVFISSHAVKSQNVRNEINYALNGRKPFLAIHIVETELPPCLQLRMGDIQAIMKYRMTHEVYERKVEKTLPRSLLSSEVLDEKEAEGKRLDDILSALRRVAVHGEAWKCGLAIVWQAKRTGFIVCDWNVEWETISPAVAKRFSELAPGKIVQLPTDVALTEYASRILECNRVLQPGTSLRKLRVNVTETPVDLVEPDIVCRFLTTSVGYRFDELRRLAQPMLMKLSDCYRADIDAHQNPARAWYSLATLQLLLGQSVPAIEALSQLMALSKDEMTRTGSLFCSGACAQALRAVNQMLKYLDSVRSELPGFAWMERLSALAMVVAVRDASASDAVQKMTSWGSGPPPIAGSDAVLILSGGSGPDMQPMVDAVRPELLRVVAGLYTLVIGSGIQGGASGLAGDIAEGFRGQIRAYGYLPKYLPDDVCTDHRYDSVLVSGERGFTPMEPLRMWTDLVAAGVDLGRVRFLSLGGGLLAHAEAAMACGFGLEVGIVARPGVAAPEWASGLAAPAAQRFTLIAPEASSLRTFLSASTKPR